MRFKPQSVFYFYSGFFAFFFSIMAYAMGIYHIEMVKMNPFQLVIVGTALELAVLICEVPTGAVADYFSRKISIIIGLLIFGAGIFIEGLFPVFLIVLISNIIWGGGFTFISGADTAWITDEVGSDKIDSILLKSVQIRNIFTFVGVFAGVSLATIQPNIPFFVSGVAFFALGILMIFIMSENNFTPAKKDHTKKFSVFSQAKSGLRLLKGNKIVYLIFAIALLGGLYNEGFDRLHLYQFIENIGLPENQFFDQYYWVAILGAGSVLLNLSLVEYIRRTSENIESKKVFILLSALSFLQSGAILFFVLTQNFYLAVILFWISYAIRNANSSVMEIIFNRQIKDSSTRATMLSFRGQLDEAGQIIGGPAIGYISKVYGLVTGFTIISILVLPIAIIYLVAVKYLKK